MFDMLLAQSLKGCHDNINFWGAASLVFGFLLLEIAAK
jgi:hypothetical protein